MSLESAANPSKNKSGGLNLNWAVRQALDKLGVDAKNPQVKEFIEREYGKLGRTAIERGPTFSTAMWTMRKKLRLELASVPPVKTEVKVPAPFTIRRLTPEPVAAVPVKVKEELISPASELLRMQEYILKTLKPAMNVIEAAGGVQAWPRLEALVKACEIG